MVVGKKDACPNACQPSVWPRFAAPTQDMTGGGVGSSSGIGARIRVGRCSSLGVGCRRGLGTRRWRLS